MSRRAKYRRQERNSRRPLSANTLDALVRSTAAQVVADDAYLQGLDI